MTTEPRKLPFSAALVGACREKCSRLCGSTTSLDLSGRGLEVLPAVVKRSRRLEVLILEQNKLTSVPLYLCELLNLKRLDLTNNKLICLPREIGSLTGLKLLKLKFNFLTSLPPPVGNLTALMALELGNNHLSDTLPVCMCRLTSLHGMDLVHNGFNALPDCVASLTRLKLMFLNSNKFGCLSPTLGQVSSLVKLTVKRNVLWDLSKDVAGLTTLGKLDLTDNLLHLLPEELGCLTSLRLLIAGRNSICSLPTATGCLTSLRALMCPLNALSSLPKTLKLLSSLREVDFGYNVLQSLPAEFGMIEGLEAVVIRQNRLSELPQKIGCLTALEAMDVDTNLLGDLPNEVCTLTSLKHAWIGLNKLTKLPSNCYLLTRLRFLDLRGNAQIIHDADVVLRGDSRVLCGDFPYEKSKGELRNKAVSRDVTIPVTIPSIMERSNFVSLGYNCDVASMLRNLCLRSFSTPFDWLISPARFILDTWASNFEAIGDVAPTRLGNINLSSFAVYKHDNFGRIRSEEVDKYARRSRRLMNLMMDQQSLTVFLRIEMADEDINAMIKLDEMFSEKFPASSYCIVLFSRRCENTSRDVRGNVIVWGLDKFYEIGAEFLDIPQEERGRELCSFLGVV